METTQKPLKRHNLSDEEIESELGRIKNQCLIAARELWIAYNDLAVEDLYTDYAIKFLENPVKKKLSIQVYKFHLIKKKFRQEKETISFSEVEEYFFDDRIEAKNNQYIKLIIEEIKKIISDDKYEKMLWYYSTLWKTRGQKHKDWPRGRDPERNKLRDCAKVEKKKLLKKIEINPELQLFFSKNLELANNYDFI